MLIAQSALATPGKQLTILLTAIGLLTVLWIATRLLNWARLLALYALLSLGYLFSYHALAFIAFPKLLKDISTLSAEHFGVAVRIFVFLFTSYLILGSVLILLRKLSGWYRRRELIETLAK